MQALRVIEKVASKIAPGRAPFFTTAQVVKALEIIGAEKGVGRKKLSEALGLGEGTIRTLVKHLKNEKLVKVSRAGITLSNFGQKIFTNLRSRISEEVEIPKSPLTVGPFNIAVLIRNAATSIKYGVEQRDAAIRAGALGATTLIFSRNKLIIPGVNEDIFQNIQPIHDMLISALKPSENDVIIIGSANEKRAAELGAKTAALELLKIHNKQHKHVNL
jgi:predicted transcriptional regulator